MGVGGEGFEGHSTGFEITVLSWNLSLLLTALKTSHGIIGGMNGCSDM